MPYHRTDGDCHRRVVHGVLHLSVAMLLACLALLGWLAYLWRCACISVCSWVSWSYQSVLVACELVYPIAYVLLQDLGAQTVTMPCCVYLCLLAVFSVCVCFWALPYCGSVLLGKN